MDRSVDQTVDWSVDQTVDRSVDQTVEVQQVRDQVLGSGYIRLFFFWFKLTLLVALVTSAVLVSVTVQSFLISCLSC